MKSKYSLPVCALLAAMLVIFAKVTHAAVQSADDFDSDWPDTPWLSASNAVNPITGWSVTNAQISGFSGYNSAPYGAIIVNSASTNAWIMSPWLTNPVGSLRFYVRNTVGSRTNAIGIESSYDVGATTWITNVIVTNSFTTTFNSFVISSNSLLSPASNQYIRLRRLNSSGQIPTCVFDDLIITHPPGSVSLSNLSRTPESPGNNQPVDVQVTVTRNGFPDIYTLTNYWREWPATNWNATAMVSNTINTFITSSSIPGKPIGATIEYMVEAAYTNEAGSYTTRTPTNSYTVRPLGSLTNVVMSGDISATLLLSSDYSWKGLISITSAVNASIHFTLTDSNGVSSSWGDTNQTTVSMPFYGHAETGAPSIVLYGTNTGYYLVGFNERTLTYGIQPCAAVDFDNWTNAPFGTYTNNGWILSDGMLTNDPTRLFRGRSAVLNGSPSASTNSYLKSPYLTNGVGTISFWYRNWETNGSPSATLVVQVAPSAASTNWVSIATLTNLVTTNYVSITVGRSDADSHCVRILNNPSGANARLCLDDVTIAEPRASVAFTNLHHSPSVPVCTNPVSVDITVAPLGGASVTNVVVCYRPGTSGPFTNTVAMTDAGGGLYAGTIPPGQGPDTGAGIVQYYVACYFDGFGSDDVSPLYAPTDGSLGPTNYVISRSYLIITNVSLIPDAPGVDDSIQIAADILPRDGASNITATAFYRIGTSGSYVSNVMVAGASNHFVTTNGIVPEGVIPGTALYYYISADCKGGNPIAPTNYPAGGTNTPLIAYLGAPALLSSYSRLQVSGFLSADLTLASNYFWRGVVALSNAVGPTFRFEGISASTSIWGVTSQAVSNFPYYGVAASNASYLTLFGTNSGYVVFEFNENDQSFVIRKASYLNFDAWTNASPYGAYTNTEGWALTDGRTTTNSPADNLRVFGGSGRSGILKEGPTTNAVLRSPYLSNGVGQISFWYRNGETNSTPPAQFTVQVAVSSSSAWTTVATFTNILSQDYLSVVVPHTDLTNRYVRILNSTNASHASLCLDEIVITEPSAGVIPSNITNSPSVPTILDDVSILADLTPVSGAVVTNATVWFRLGTTGLFDSITMTNSGIHWGTISPIHHPSAGLVQYTIQYMYSGFESELGPTFLPGGTNSPQGSFTVVAASDFRTENFDTGWPNAPWGGASNAVNPVTKWAVTNVQVGQTIYANSPLYCALILRSATNTATITSSMLSNTIGTVTFAAQNQTANRTNLIGVESSYDTNATTWVTNAIVTNLSGATPAYNVISVPVLNPTARQYIRLRCYDMSGSGSLIIDDITVTYPPANVAIENVFLTPGYPSTGDSVNVSCQITSINSMFPAYNITPTLFYFRDGDVTNSLSMLPVYGNRYQTVAPLSFSTPLLRDTKVNYYIQCNFSGYYGSAAENKNPQYYPAGGVYTPTNYVVRAFGSDYQTMSVSVNGSNFTARLLTNSTWQVAFSTESTNVLSFSFTGSRQATTNGYSPIPQSWGNSSTWQTNLPLADVAVTGQSAFAINGDFVGQYLVRFNESTGEYLIIPCVWNGFDAETDDTGGKYRRRNLTSTGSGAAVDFDDWQVNTSQTRTESFDGINDTWTSVSNFTDIGKGGYFSYVSFGMRSTNIAGEATVMQTRPTVTLPTDTFMAQKSDGDPSPFLHGIGQITARFRPMTNTSPASMAFYLFPTNAYVSETSFQDYSSWVKPPVVSVSGITNTASFTTLTWPMQTSTTYDVIFAATQDMYIAELSVSDWYATNNAGGGWTTEGSWIRSGAGTNNNECLLEPSRAANDAIYLQSPMITGGISTIDFRYAGPAPTVGAFSLIVASNSPPVWTNAFFATNVLFNRRSAYIALPDGFTNLASGITLSVWVKPVDGNDSGARFVDLSRGPGVDEIVFGRSAASNIVFAVWTNGVQGALITVSNAVQVDAWQNYVVTEETNRTVRIFTNGAVAIATNAAMPFPQSVTRTENYLGRSPWLSDASFSGLMDEVRISSVARSTNWTWAEYQTIGSNEWFCNYGTVTTNIGATTNYQMVISFPFYQRSEVLTNFPVLITLFNNVGNSGFSFASHRFRTATGYDLRFRNSTDTTDLNYEIEKWSTSSPPCHVWVQVPRLSNATASIIMRWGNPSATNQLPSTTNGATWSQGYLGVWHMSTNTPDSTSYRMNGTADLAVTTNAPGGVGNSQWFDVRTTNYTQFSCALASGLSPLYVRIQPIPTNYYGSTNFAPLLLDDVVISGFASPSDWFMNNAAIEYHDQGHPPYPRQFYLGALYFNSNTFANIDYDPAVRPYPDLASYLRTPAVPGGIGEVSFWYRNWTTNGTARPAQLLIQRSTTGGTNDSEWSPLATLSNITNTEDYAYYQTSVYDTSNHYVRILNQDSETLAGLARVCIDDVVVASPLACSLSLSNLTISPPIPLFSNQVDVSVDVCNLYYGPSNISVTAYYGTGSTYAALASAIVTGIPMTCISNGFSAPGRPWYRFKTSPQRIPAYPADTYVTYHALATYDGYHAEVTRPRTNTQLTVQPTWYYPLEDYTNNKAYYLVFSCPTGSVWINEFNITDWTYYPDLYQYVELCGKAGINLANWKLQIMNAVAQTQAVYTITNSATLASTTNGFGFWVLGKTTVTNRQQTLTNSLPTAGGIRLLRTSGAAADAVCYTINGGSSNGVSALISRRFLYAGNDDDLWDYAPILSGYSTNGFTWGLSPDGQFSPGWWNDGQYFVFVPEPTITISATWLDSTNVWIQCIAASNLAPAPWYSTNLMDTSGWSPVSSFWSTYSSASNTYTIHFNRTNNPVNFYRITGTNGP